MLYYAGILTQECLTILLDQLCTANKTMSKLRYYNFLLEKKMQFVFILRYSYAKFKKKNDNLCKFSVE